VQLNPTELGFQKSIDVIIMVVLGGLGSISGAAIAATILTVLLESLRTFEVSLFALMADIAAIVLALTVLIGLARTVSAAQRRSGGRVSAGEAWRGLARPAAIAVALYAAAWIRRLAARVFTIMLGDYRMILYSLALILMMIARPQGLFGVREVWERAAWEWLVPLHRPTAAEAAARGDARGAS
jgi:branched-chain amino acid transport system permease protein